MYIYIFEDGKVAQDERAPTELDLLFIQDGTLQVLRAADGMAQVTEVGPDGAEDTLPMSKVRNPGGGGLCHVPAPT